MKRKGRNQIYLILNKEYVHICIRALFRASICSSFTFDGINNFPIEDLPWEYNVLYKATYYMDRSAELLFQMLQKNIAVFGYSLIIKKHRGFIMMSQLFSWAQPPSPSIHQFLMDAVCIDRYISKFQSLKMGEPYWAHEYSWLITMSILSN